MHKTGLSNLLNKEPEKNTNRDVWIAALCIGLSVATIALVLIFCKYMGL